MGFVRFRMDLIASSKQAIGMLSSFRWDAEAERGHPASRIYSQQVAVNFYSLKRLNTTSVRNFTSDAVKSGNSSADRLPEYSYICQLSYSRPSGHAIAYVSTVVSIFLRQWCCNHLHKNQVPPNLRVRLQDRKAPHLARNCQTFVLVR